MKSGSIILTPFLILCFLPACVKQSNLESEESFSVSRITADYTPVEEATKNQIGSVNYDVYWSSGDQIAIVNMTQNTINRYTVNSSSVGKIKGVFDANGEYSYADGDQLVAVYPYDAASWSSGNLYVTLKDEVAYSSSNNSAFSDNDIQVSSLMTGAQFKTLSANSSSLPFYRMVAFFTVTCVFSGSELRAQYASEMAFCHNGICGIAQVQFNDGVPSVAVNSGQGNSLTIALPDQHKMSSVSYVVKFIPVFPVNVNTGLAFVLKTQDYESGFYLEQAATIAARKNQSFVLFDGNYTQVPSRLEATNHLTWWWCDRSIDFGDFNAGSFLTPQEIGSLGGNSAGSFVSGD